VVSLDVTDLGAPALHQEVLELRRRVKKLTALLRLALVLLRCSGFELTHARLPDGRAKIRILRAVDRAREYVPLRAVLRFLRLPPSRFADTFAPVNSVAVLLDASQAAASSDTAPVVLADAGVETVNAQVDALIHTGVLRRLLAFTELKFSNSMIEAWWRSPC
jgi:hypothetical protein